MSNMHTRLDHPFIAKVIQDTEKGFAEHEVSVRVLEQEGFQPMTVVEWRKPGDSCYAMRFIIHCGFLYVAGDLGEATYRWYGPDIGLAFFKNIGFDYFLGKCQASEYGSQTEMAQFDRDTLALDIAEEREEAEKDLADALAELRETGECDEDCQGLDERLAAFNELAEVMSFSDINSKHDWWHFLDENDDLVAGVFGGDWWEYVPGYGLVPPIRQIMHWVGIKMAAVAAAEKEKVAA